MVAPLLTFGQRLVALALLLDVVLKVMLLRPHFTRLGQIFPVGMDGLTRVEGVEHRVEMPAVARAGRVALDVARGLVILVDVGRQLVAEVVLVVVLRPGAIDVLPMPLCRLPLGTHAGPSRPSCCAAWSQASRQ